MQKNDITQTEVIIVGAGPSGLAVVLFLARANRKVIIFDRGKKRMPENAKIHEYLGFDNMNPSDYFLKTRTEVASFGGVFIATPVRVNSLLAENLCEVDQNGFAITDEFCQSRTTGLWVIRNAQDPKGHMSHASTDGTQVGPFVTNYLIHSYLKK